MDFIKMARKKKPLIIKIGAYTPSDIRCFRVQMLPNSKLHYSDEVILQIVNKQIKVTETAPPFSEYTSWPFSYIRNYNHGDDIFNFECGRSSDTGEGHFYFYSSQAETIFNLVHSTSLAISQRMRESRNEPPKIEAPPPPSNTRRTTQYPVQSPATPLSAGARTPGYPYFPSDASTTSSSTTGDFAHAPSPPLPARPPPMESLTNAGGGPPRSDLQHHQHRPSNASLQSAGGMPPSRPSASSLVREVPPIPASYTPGQPSPSLPPRPDTSSTTSRQHQLQQQHQQQQQLNRAPPTRRSEGYPAGHAQMPGQATPTSASSAKPPPFSQKSLPSQVGNFPVVDVNERPLPPIPLKEGYLKYHTQVM